MASSATRLRVMSGLHAGATAILPDDGMSIIGSAGDCDVQLFDSDIAPRHLAISRSGETFTLRCMDHGCTLGGRHLPIGESCNINPGNEVELGDSRVVVGVENMSAAVIVGGEQQTAANSVSRTRGMVQYALSLILVVSGLTAVFATDVEERDPLPEVEAAIAAIGADETVQASISDGTVVVTGIVSETHYAELRQALSAVDFAVVNSVQSSTLLLEQVRSVFRTNGYHVELSYRDGGVVQVQNLDATNPTVQAVARRVRADVPAVTKLEFSDVGAEPPADSLAYPTDPQKRLTTIVDGDIAYVATEDGGRYFVGAVLPGGFVLKRISEDGVQVDDNGEIRWLKL